MRRFQILNASRIFSPRTDNLFSAFQMYILPGVSPRTTELYPRSRNTVLHRNHLLLFSWNFRRGVWWILICSLQPHQSHSQYKNYRSFKYVKPPIHSNKLCFSVTKLFLHLKKFLRHLLEWPLGLDALFCPSTPLIRFSFKQSTCRF
jgi:hypothetical protein